MNEKKVLLLTVGTGDIANLKSSLIDPLLKSIEHEGPWARIVLLPSTVTENNARLVQQERGNGEIDIEIDPLPIAGSENDVDRCFSHFNAKIEKLREAFPPRAIVADFTRGTKAMSAALVLAALRHGLAELRYITGQRDDRGSVIAGTERIQLTNPAIALDLRRVDAAADLMRHGAFAAADTLLPDESLAIGKEQRDLLRNLARFYAAWDRLDYAGAAEIGQILRDRGEVSLPQSWKGMEPTPEVLAWVAGLAEQPDRKDHRAMAAWLRRLAVDLLANAERRVGALQFEDALIRSYRVLELVGQARLFDLGLDSECLPPDDPQIITLRKRLHEKGEGDFSPSHVRGCENHLMASRELAARLLKEKGDQLAKTLLQLGQNDMRVKARNTSVLIHGYQANAPRGSEEWKKIFGKLWDLLGKDQCEKDLDKEEFASRRALARYPAFSHLQH